MPIFFLNFHFILNILPAKMIRKLETEIRGLQRELAEVQRGQALLRLQPCQGDSEIRKKDADLDELDRRAKTLTGTLQDLARKRQLLISQCTTGGIYDSANLQQNTSDVSGNQETGQDHGKGEGGQSR
jgi:hypothetical protein